MSYRPWGLLGWALALSDNRKWLFIGALGTEVRSLAAWRGVRALGAEAEHRILEILDMPSRFTVEAEMLLADRWVEFGTGGGREDWTHRKLGLLDEFHRIDSLARTFASAGPHVMLDITSLPKRYFFPILRRLYLEPNVRDLIVTYTLPEQYAQDGRPLSEGAGSWTHIPGFLPAASGESELLIAGAGFATQNLQAHVRSITRHESIKLLIPFPAPLDAVHRSW